MLLTTRTFQLAAAWGLCAAATSAHAQSEVEIRSVQAHPSAAIGRPENPGRHAPMGRGGWRSRPLSDDGHHTCRRTTTALPRASHRMARRNVGTGPSLHPTRPGRRPSICPIGRRFGRCGGRPIARN